MDAPDHRPRDDPVCYGSFPSSAAACRFRTQITRAIPRGEPVPAMRAVPLHRPCVSDVLADVVDAAAA